jgi:hypothetical protein
MAKYFEIAGGFWIRRKCIADIDGRRAVAVVSVCNPECMIWADEGVPLQFDDGHLTRQGSAYVAREFGRQVL